MDFVCDVCVDLHVEGPRIALPFRLSKGSPKNRMNTSSSLVRGYHPRLVGGISSRPEFPYANLLMENLSHYSSIANQPYSLNVRLELPLIS